MKKGFGIYLVLFPILTGQIYGFMNFGKYFSYLQIGGSIASKKKKKNFIFILNKFFRCYYPDIRKHVL